MNDMLETIAGEMRKGNFSFLMQPRIQDGRTGASARGVPEAKVVEAVPEGGRKEMSGIFRYGMRLRGFSVGAQPMDGFEEREGDPTGKYHDILAYKRKLTLQEEAEYELDYLGQPDKDYLRPCPFCGGKGMIEKILNEESLGKPGWDTYWIRCEDCDAETTACTNEEEAAYRWNMRAEEEA